MNDKFLNVCDGVNLITKPCEYRGFKLKPGMLLFDTNEKCNLTESFVAVCDITNQQNQHIGNLSNAILLSGYSLKDSPVKGQFDHFRVNYCILEGSANYNKICEVVDLALGESRLRRLFLESNYSRYLENRSFYAPSNESDKSYIFTHVIGDVYRQYFNSPNRDRFVTLSKEQFEFFNNRHIYGILSTGYGSISTDVSGLKNDSEFHNILNAYFGVNYDGCSKEDVDKLVQNLEDYYSTVGGADSFIKKDGLRIAFDEFDTNDEFHVQPFNVAIDYEFAKEHLYRACEYHSVYSGNFLAYERRGFEYEDISNIMPDVGLHSVYITSHYTYDYNGEYDYNDNCIDIFKGYVFDGSKYVPVLLGFKDVPRELIDNVIAITDESDYYDKYIKGSQFDNITQLGGLIESRLDSLGEFKKQGFYVPDEMCEFTEYIYNKYYSKVSERMSIFVTYSKLTDAELQNVGDVRFKSSGFDVPDLDDIDEIDF